MSKADDARHWANMLVEMAENVRDSVAEGDFDDVAGPMSASHEVCNIAPRLAAVIEEAASEEEGGDESGELIEQPVVVRALLGSNVFYFTHRKQLANGRGEKMYGYRTDVTDAANHLVEQEIIKFLDYCYETYGVELLRLDDPKAGGYSGLGDEAGHEYLNETIAEWRQS